MRVERAVLSVGVAFFVESVCILPALVVSRVLRFFFVYTLPLDVSVVVES